MIFVAGYLGNDVVINKNVVSILKSIQKQNQGDNHKYNIKLNHVEKAEDKYVSLPDYIENIEPDIVFKKENVCVKKIL